MPKKNLKIKGGYTIIETMIAVSIFLIVVMIGMGSLLNANLVHQKSRDMRSIMDNLSFIMEDMSRNLRTGYNYACISSETAGGSLGTSTPISGENCGGVAFKPATGGSQWGYEFVSLTIGSVTTSYIIKSTDNGTTWYQITPDEIVIDTVKSGFSVLGAEPASEGNQKQPFVTIKIVGTINSKGVATPFSLQTSVSQRLIDI
ncbi:MAG: prepilin-type N-terminal cleavage/methylation domain-containing protein [Patescibacteria group bacterium]